MEGDNTVRVAYYEHSFIMNQAECLKKYSRVHLLAIALLASFFSAQRKGTGIYV